MKRKDTTDLIVVGAGAAGLMAGVTAGEMGLRVVVVERRHQPGRKLLMCGNNRCNMTYACSASEMLERYGDPVAPFLQRAVEAFPPNAFRSWLRERGLTTKVHKDHRVFPSSEKAADVLHFFTDRLRDLSIPLILNCPVQDVKQKEGGYQVGTANLSLEASCVLIATGGVSYPKTGSVGDGQKMAKQLGHRIVPYRPGLVGFELPGSWMTRNVGLGMPAARVEIVSSGEVKGVTGGALECTAWGISGPAIVDASRVVARLNLKDVELHIDLCPAMQSDMLAREILKRGGIAGWLMDSQVAQIFLREELGGNMDKNWNPDSAGKTARLLKHWILCPAGTRPLKEAMVTVGGIDLADIDPQTMESKRCPGLFFAGEVMDVDGPTGGFNLHAAFSTAKLAVETVSGRSGGARKSVSVPRRHQDKHKKRRRRR